MPVGSNSLPASSHTLWATKSHLQGVSWTINCCCLLLAHCECEVCIRDTFFSHVRELMSVCLQPSWPHFHAFLGHRSSGESLCRGDPPPELIISSRKCFAFAKSCSALRSPHFFSGDQSVLAFAVLWAEAVVSSSFLVLWIFLYDHWHYSCTPPAPHP